MKRMKDLKTAGLIIIALLFLVGLAWILSFYLTSQTDFNWQISIIDRQPKDYRWLDGQPVKADEVALKPIAVILENHFESRPISGLDQASIIYEVIIEGDITRFLAIFDSEFKAKKIGPVRSVRPFFVDLVEEWNPVLFHAGGSQAGLARIKQSPVYNINEISGDGIYFWRDTKRGRPHNLYTSANQIKRAITAKDIDLEADFSPWLFKDDPSATTSQQLVKIDFFNNPLYQVEYEYNPKQNNYTRYLGGKIHKTDKGIILKAKNIVVQQVDFEIIDDYGRLDVDVESGGEAEIYQDGKKIEAKWREINDRTRFYNLENKEIKFNRGTIWVELVFNNF